MKALVDSWHPAADGQAVVEYLAFRGRDMEPPGEVTQLLRAWSEGDRTVENRLFDLVLPDLQRIARHLMSKERREHSLQPSALLNEAYMRLLTARERDWESRRHFFAIAARVMRRLLIDYARMRTAPQGVPVDPVRSRMCSDAKRLEEAILIDALLDDLESENPEWCSVVEMKYFMGLTDSETAEALGLPLRTVQRRFGDARRWLYERLKSTPCSKTANATNS